MPWDAHMFYYHYHHHHHHYHNHVSYQQPHSITHLHSKAPIHNYHHDHLVLKLLEVPSKFWTDGNVSSIGEWWTMMMMMRRRRIMIVMVIIMMRHRLDCWRCYNVYKYHRISVSYNNSNYAFLSEYSHWIDDYWTDIHCKSDCAFLSEDCYRIDDYWTDTGSVHHIPRHEVVHLLNHQPISYRSTSTIVGVITVFS